jgi:Flp pilus assembly protein TadD
VPLIGLFILVVWSAHDAAARWRTRPPQKWLLPLAATAVLVACGVEARAQVQHWKNDQALWTHAMVVTLGLDRHRASQIVTDLLSENLLLELQALVETHVGSVRPPAPALARVHVGRHFLRHRQLDDAVVTFTEATRIDPSLAEAHSDLGLALSRQGRVDEAVAAYQEALRLNPALAETHNDLGFVLAQQGKLAAAVPHFAEAARLRPALTDAWRNLGLALANLGRFDEAAAALKEVLRLTPDDATVRSALAELQKRGGKPPDGGRP